VQLLDIKITESQTGSLEYTDGKFGKSALRWKLTAGLIDEK